jgi:KDO2-lipid IV(A) lauroyltransferase
MMSKTLKMFKYWLESAFVFILVGLFSLLPVDIASSIGGKIARTIGPYLPPHKTALKNLQLAFPDLTQEEYKQTLTGMWDNLGRIFAEYPHLSYISKNRVVFENPEIIDLLIHDNSAAVIIGAHIGNWEIVAPSCLQKGLKIDLIYRKPNNPYVDKLLGKLRSLDGKIITFAKSRAGVKDAIDALKNSHHIALLIDQKYNEGIPALFFGTPAMTSPAFIKLAQKFHCPLVLGQVVRMNGANFKIKVFQPIETYAMNDKPRDAEDIINEIHEAIETWIKEQPAQWLWLHQRWNKRAKELYKNRETA